MIFWHGRQRGRNVATLADWVAANITLQRGVHGAKPMEFCFWLFEMLGLTPGDDLADLYPGSGAVSMAWDAWKRQGQMFERARVTADAPLFAEVR